LFVAVVQKKFSSNICYPSYFITSVGLAAVPAAFSPLRDNFPPAKLAVAVGVFGSAYSGWSVVGLLVGASIIHNIGWHSTFFFIAPRRLQDKLFLADYVLFSTHVSFKFRASDKTMVFSQTQPNNKKWVNNSSSHYYSQTEFEHFIDNFDDDNADVYTVMQRLFREGKAHTYTRLLYMVFTCQKMYLVRSGQMDGTFRIDS
jgi:MFS family permease